MTAPSDARELDRLADAVALLRRRITEHEARFVDVLEPVAEEHRASALNLVHYLAVRQHDLRDLQRALHRRGLSSLGRMEAYVAATLGAVLGTLCQLRGREHPRFPAPPVTFDEGRALLEQHTARLLGDTPPGRDVRIMVTMPQSAATDYPLVRDLVAAGMNVARINGAKDGPDVWRAMLVHLQRAREETGRPCLVEVDLEGPNPRTGEVAGELEIRLEVGDRLQLCKSSGPASVALRDAQGRCTVPARVSCTLPEALSALRVGERVCYDDGEFDGKVVAVDEGGVTLEILRVSRPFARLKANKGLNFPDSDLGLPSLTPADYAVLDFAAAHADIVALSFVRDPADVRALGRALADRGASRLGIVLKVETRRAFEQLPQLLLAALAHPAVGVMVARGDMGVELGFERLAEAQEEILWLCEAAHVPVVWATQVLESLAKTGLPSRAEVTDAAMGGRAECVMLNKGDYIVQTIAFLDDVLQRMQEHRYKKHAMLRKLGIAGG